MSAIIISIGNELLNGRTVNSNAAFIARQLFESGITTRLIETIADDPEAIRQSLQHSLKKAEVVIVTGGLGPTHDDITKKVVAEYFDSGLVMNEDVLKMVEDKFRSRGKEMPEINRNQALVPDKAEWLENPFGTAPGLLFKNEGRYVFVMPGVPREMKSILTGSVIPYLQKNVIRKPVKVKLYRTTGIAESRLYELCHAFFDRFGEYQIAFLPSFIGVDIRAVIIGPAANDHKRLKEFEEGLLKRAGKYIFTTREEEIEDVLGAILSREGKTISVAESCTGGLLQDRLTNVPGSSEYFMGGVVSYSNRSKAELLGVQQDSLEKYGAVSETVAREMAEGTRRVFHTDYALSTTGIAGPAGGSAEKPVGLVYIGLATPEKTQVKKFNFVSKRRLNKELATQAALESLRRVLVGISIK